MADELPACDCGGGHLHRWACALAAAHRKAMIMERVEAALAASWYDMGPPDRDGLWRDDGGVL